jgi:membrane protein
MTGIDQQRRRPAKARTLAMISPGRTQESTAAFAAIFLNSWRRFLAHRIPLVAAGATFFILLALFPAFASAVSLYGLFSDRAALASEVYRLSAFLPRGAVITLNAELQRLIAEPPQRAGLTFLFSSFFALWSASGGARALMEGLDVACEVSEDRSFIRLVGVSLLLTILGIVAAAVSLNLAVVVPAFFAPLPFRSLVRPLFSLLAWPACFGFGILALSIVYRYGPCRPSSRAHWFSWGAALASAAWLAGTAIFKFYVGYSDSFNRVYGSLGAVIGFMVWIWLTLVILLFGAELNGEIERSRR